jgi:hypothetical protein
MRGSITRVAEMEAERLFRDELVLGDAAQKRLENAHGELQNRLWCCSPQKVADGPV